VDVFGIILSGGKLAVALAAILGFLGLLGRLLWAIYRATKRVETLLALTKDTTLQYLRDRADANAAAIKEIRASIGTNGGKSVFDRLKEQDQQTDSLRNDIAAIQIQAKLNADAAAKR
jgi:hypothetical protein